METTTIQVKKNLKKKLDMLKVYPNEPMDSVIERLANMAIDEEPLSKEEIRDIEKSLNDIKKGKVHSLEEVKKDLGIK
jgi:predicted transcriptional regulator